jgi:LysM repeat protein
VIVALALAIAFVGGRASAKPAHAAPAAVVVVHTGDTLWSIARHQVGSRGDPRPLIQRLIARNHLRDGVITVGERLIVPASR